MALRAFRDATGVLWHVWNVIPGARESAERRVGYDRRSPEPVLRYTGPERRSADRRRLSFAVATGLAAGWLTFESPGERRRLAPIPPGWDRCSESGLARLCEQARPVAQTWTQLSGRDAD